MIPYLRPMPIARVLLDGRSVNITRECEWQRQRRLMRICFGSQPEPTRISMAQLYETLDHGRPGEYILEEAQ